MSKSKDLVFIPDEEITLQKRTEAEKGNDLLNTSTYVDALVRCISSARTEKTFTIGLFGEWGSGKSSIVKTAQDRIEAKAKEEKKNVKFITYDAWKYAGDSFRRMFLFELKNALGFEENALMQRFYCSETEETEIKTSLNGKKILLSIVYTILAIIVLAIIGIFAGWKVAVPSGVALASLGFSLYTWMFDYLKVSINKPLLFAPEQFEDCYHDMLAKAMKRHNWLQKRLNWVTGGRYNKELSKLIIVIDNIDRCQPDITYSLLSDIKSFLGDSQDVIFIVPVDVDALRKHIVGSNNSSAHDADEFLRKFFNVSIWIKTYQNDEMYDFTQNLNQKYGLGLTTTSVSVISREFATNPRRIIQLLNNLVVEFTHYEQEFLDKYQSLICLLTIIREEYPDDMKLLVENPVLIFNFDKKGKKNDEKYFLSGSICNFLHKTRSVFENMYDNREVIDQIISNSNVFSNLPKGTEDALYSYDMQSMRVFVTENGEINQYKLALLKRCLCDRIKKAVERGIYIPDLLNYFRSVIELHKEGLLNSEDYEDFNNAIHKADAWDNIVSDLMPQRSADLADIAVAFFKNKLADLRNNISEYISRLELSKDKITDTKINSVLNVCKSFSKEMLLLPIKEKFINVYELRPKQALEQTYEEPCELFSDKLTQKVISEIKVDDFGLEETANWQFQQICKQTNLRNGELLNEYLKKVTEVMPDYSHKGSQNDVLIQILTDINYSLSLCPTSILTSAEGISGFTGKLQKNIAVNDGYGRTVNKSLYADFIDNKETLSEFIKFLDESGKHYFSEMYFSESLMTFLVKNKEVGGDAMATLGLLSDKGSPIEKYAASIAEYPTLDELYLKVLHYCFNNPDTNKPRVNDNAWIKARIDEILNEVVKNSNEELADFLNKESESETINAILTDSLSALKLSDLEKLPIIRDKAVKTFEEHIDSYLDNQTVLSIIGRCGSKSGIRALIRIIVNKLTGHKESEAIELIMSLRYCNSTDRKLIESTIEAIDESIIDKSSRKEITKKLDDIIEK